MDYFQFPWRFLSLSIIISSFLVASVVSQGKIKKIILSVFLILLCIGLTYQYTKPAYYMQRNDQYYITRSNFINGTNSGGDSFNTVWFNPQNKKESKLLIIDGTFNITEKGVNKYKIDLYSKDNKKAILNLAYFPGWEVKIDGEKVLIKSDKDGKIEFLVKKGKHFLEVSFNDTPVRKISFFLSAITFFLIIIWFLNFTYVKLKKCR